MGPFLNPISITLWQTEATMLRINEHQPVTTCCILFNWETHGFPSPFCLAGVAGMMISNQLGVTMPELPYLLLCFLSDWWMTLIHPDSPLKLVSYLLHLHPPPQKRKPCFTLVSSIVMIWSLAGEHVILHQSFFLSSIKIAFHVKSNRTTCILIISHLHSVIM